MKKLSMRTKVISLAVIAVAVIVIVIAPTSAPARLIVATTTSLDNTGLWDYLEPIFEERYDVDLRITAKGTGMALELGKNGDVDAVTVHDPLQEAAFIADGYALAAEVDGNVTERVPWAYNYFIIVGPETDPAGISGGNLTPEEAFQKIQQVGEDDPETVKFVSRGDNSGTHGKEKAVWAAAGYNYTADIQGTGATAGWYIEAGSGMGATLVMADEMIAYTLSDKGTFLAYQGDLDLVSLVDAGDILLNVYSVIICKNGSNPEMANNLVDFLRAPEIQDLIAGFGVPEYGGPLFYPYDPEICQ
ncbi:MAG TPA: substrate-binding domain-containing protein [Dehalococcoidia bacterium]|nr:substrate-binding domain-containing protein [Dehalococcoidia bacterium]